MKTASSIIVLTDGELLDRVLDYTMIQVIVKFRVILLYKSLAHYVCADHHACLY